jgi:hypothetical protein
MLRHQPAESPLIERDDHSSRRNAHELPRGGIRLGALEKLTVKDTDLFAQALPDG